VAPQLTHEEIQELLGVYALDAVDPDEAAAVEAHLPTCPRCRAEVAEHREAAALLSFSGTDAPHEVWSRIAGELDEPPPAAPIPLVPRPLTATTDRMWRRAVVAVAGIAASVLAVLGAQVVRQDHRLDQLASATGERGIEQAAAVAAVAPGAETVRLTSEDGSAAADAVVLPDGRGYLVQAELPALADGRTYQLWGIADTSVISLGLLGGDPGVTAFRVDGTVDTLAITAEERGGAVAPTGAPVVQGTVSA
jgi:anti-sigma factor RsiW